MMEFDFIMDRFNEIPRLNWWIHYLFPVGWQQCLLPFRDVVKIGHICTVFEDWHSKPAGWICTQDYRRFHFIKIWFFAGEIAAIIFAVMQCFHFHFHYVNFLHYFCFIYLLQSEFSDELSEDPLDNVELLQDQLDFIPYLCRFQVWKTRIRNTFEKFYISLLVKLNNPSIFSKIADEFDFNTIFSCVNCSMKLVVCI